MPAFPARSASSTHRIGAYPFLALITVPTFLLLLLACTDIFLNLDRIEDITNLLAQEHLPGIMKSQRTLINIETLRRNAEIVSTSENQQQRRAARINTQTLITESVFEGSHHPPEFAENIQNFITEMDKAKTKSAALNNSLHQTELKISALLARLSLTLKMPSPLQAQHGINHGTSLEENQRMYVELSKTLHPLFMVCRSQDLPEKTKVECAYLRQIWQDLKDISDAKIQQDIKARENWKRLDITLHMMSDTSSTVENKRAYAAMEHIKLEAREIRLAFYASCLLLLIIILAFAIVMHRAILAPIALAAHTLNQIRLGLPTAPLPPVRLRELQQLMDLLPALKANITQISTRSGELEEEKNRYANLSLVDALTGIGNRRSFDMELETARSLQSLALLMIDVDMFKLYNDTYGHQAGDACLISVAQAMEKSLLRPCDIIFRYGGEEFAVILPGISEESALMMAEMLLHTVQALRIAHPISPVTPQITISIGLALRVSSTELSNEMLIAHADAALYHAKKSGRNRVCSYQP